MMTKKWALLSLSAIPFILAGCDTDNLDSVQESSTEIDRVKSETVETFNQLVTLETNLQAHFDETLQTDEELTTLSDETSPVFENISAREDLVAELETKQSDFDAFQESLTTYEGERLDHAELAAVDEAVENFKTHLSSYLEGYQTSLTNQREYFTGIAQDEATYDTFTEGIHALNDERHTLSQSIPEMDNVLVELDDHLSTLQSSIDEQLSEE